MMEHHTLCIVCRITGDISNDGKLYRNSQIVLSDPFKRSSLKEQHDFDVASNQSGLISPSVSEKRAKNQAKYILICKLRKNVEQMSLSINR